MAFHVPERARLTAHPHLASTLADGNNGAFFVPSVEPGWTLACLASDGDGWEHVSVHAFREPGPRMRTPTWKEMAHEKDLFWDDEDEVVQYHPRRSEYVNLHPHVLHLWRPIGVTIPRPDPGLVGPRA